MSLLKETKFLLRRYRIYPQKSFGQNFLVEPSIFPLMADYASLRADDWVLDVGAGLGFLTRFLAGKCKGVLAVESDARLVRHLHEWLKDLPNVKIIFGDVLRVEIPSFNKVVSIPPYHISSQLILWLFDRSFECAVLVFQKEFANRLAANVSEKEYGWLAAVAYYYVDVEVLDDVPKWMFYPQPEVDSVIVRLKAKKQKPFQLKDRALFRRLTQSLFTHRNRLVENALLAFMKSARLTSSKNFEKILEAIPFRGKRVRELAPEDFGVLANVLVE
ncbi:MAG: 16S rRNA (adenine(1518)-N(6)/adenine(1519)-N(6))-dimethyltransferase RsmA [Candidatus Bathyarchaeia archaeon]